MPGDAVLRHLLPALMAAVLLGGLAGSTPANVGVTAPFSPHMTPLPPQMPRSLYISGHSLTAPPFPDYLAGMVLAEGRPFDWDMQHLFGSALRDRTKGADGADSGYRAGVDRKGEPADALGGLAGRDALLLAEQHSLLESLIWKAMIPSAADYIARFRTANPTGRAYLFASWLNIDDPGDPRRWIAYERAAGTAWRCAAARIAEVADAPVTAVPAAEALALLVERASAGRLRDMGISGPRGATAAIFIDDVHLTPAGNYYVALITYGILFGGLPAEAGIPEQVSPGMAAALREVAGAFLDSPTAKQGAPGPEACRAYLGDRFAAHYLAYVRDARWRRDGAIAAYLKWVRFRVTWPRLLRGGSPDNPFAAPGGA